MLNLRSTALLALVTLILTPSLALAHIGIGPTDSFRFGVAHPFSGLDHITVMTAVGLWAALKGGRALWVWPCVFVCVMLFGGALGMAHVHLPFVEPGILASVVALGLFVALAIDLPLWVGAAVIAIFALFHGHAHGTEVAENVGGIEYAAGFALATATLHAIGLATGVGLSRFQLRPIIRLAGAGCVVAGVGLATGVF